MFVKSSYAICSACGKRIDYKETIYAISTGAGTVGVDGIVMGSAGGLTKHVCLKCHEVIDTALKAIFEHRKKQGC